MPDPTCLIDTRHIDYQPGVPRQPADPIDLFAYISSEMRTPSEIPPLVVRFDPPWGKYLILPSGPVYTDEGLPLDAARLLGLSYLPCRVVGDDPSSPTPRPLPGSAPPPGPDRPIPDPVRLEPLFRDLLHALARMAGAIRRRTSTAALRVSDDDDWRQEVLLALWRELRERDQPRLNCASAVRRYICGVLRKQAARAMKLGGRTCPLPDGWTDSARTVPDELIVAREDRRLDEAVEDIQALIDRANEALRDALSRLPAREATAAGAWLDGAGYRAAGVAGGLTLAQMRRVTLRLRGGLLASLLCWARRELEAIYRACPAAAGRIDLGRLTRLLADPEEPC